MTPWPPKQPWRSAPTTPQSASVQSIFNTSSPVLSSSATARVVPRDPTNIRGNTLHYAKTLFGSSYGYIWWIPLHNFILAEVWGAFGAGPVVGMFISFVVVFAIFLFYGLFRAIYEAETASGAATAAAAGGASTLPPSQGGAALNSAGTRAFFGAQGATNAPPLFSNRQQQSAPPAPAAAAPRPVVGNRSLAIYHVPDCAWADKIARQNRVEFDSPAVAHSAGFRPCRVCKP
jgi:hypothetical protein